MPLDGGGDGRSGNASTGHDGSEMDPAQTCGLTEVRCFGDAGGDPESVRAMNKKTGTFQSLFRRQVATLDSGSGGGSDNNELSHASCLGASYTHYDAVVASAQSGYAVGRGTHLSNALLTGVRLYAYMHAYLPSTYLSYIRSPIVDPPEDAPNKETKRRIEHRFVEWPDAPTI
ncbi:hypothetical protein HETIRDRAFT_108212 [Heterobasidion irregulare TC 32-1]|uniref:Uncharacterized protein n=1 Tax=Heterobasidion irregulare (strain TC 32-1) TaxID=747525 RepID=W4JQ07_HETIT|nr:uncharacterized protein HETIRDRAFT_108212 [Heterobasidion irregulare TC 32-1]ETW75170.1 hypothetical protein HETIRDRAFT_108212 [Heterobasidion irregulare TC 32-1]